MSSLASLTRDHPLRRGDKGADIIALQMALSAAGYRIGANGVYDGDFGGGTELAVERFQRAHGLKDDGVVGEITGALLDAPHAVLVATATPALVPASVGGPSVGWPHDDTASMLAFYGNPDHVGFEGANLVPVPVPFPMTYADEHGVKPIPHIMFHHKCADALGRTLNMIWEKAGKDPASPILRHVAHFSGSFNNRSIRGSSRKSCHAFGCAADFDAEHLPLGHGIAMDAMPPEVSDSFTATGFLWGNLYVGRKDPMHFQMAHE